MVKLNENCHSVWKLGTVTEAYSQRLGIGDVAVFENIKINYFLMQNIDTKAEYLTSSGNIANTLLCAAFSTRTNPVSELYNMDCVEGMKHYPDKYFDLVIVDPPYGLDFGSFNRTNTDSSGNRYKANKYKNGSWDLSIPEMKYFIELFRVSKNPVIWGGNYFDLPPTQCFLFWYKQNPVENFSDGEMAWTSFKRPAMCFDYRYYGNIQGKSNADDKIHPTQKPKELYYWILKKLAEPGQRILDTHVGSGSSRIACFNEGFDFVGFEIDKEYCELSDKRFINETKQQRLF